MYYVISWRESIWTGRVFSVRVTDDIVRAKAYAKEALRNGHGVKITKEVGATIEI